MLRVVIADDERNICTLIQSLVDWEALELTLVGVVHSGASACELIFQERPDIAILDIKMPGMDGLEIIKKAQDKGLSTKFLLISGHKNFAYAHTALRYGVEWYLLKPINRQELHDTLLQISTQILTDQEDRVVIHNMEGKLRHNVELNRKRLLHSLLLGEKNGFDVPLETINQEYDTHFASGVFCLLTVKVDGMTACDMPQLEVLLNQLKSYLDAFDREHAIEAVSLKQPDEVSLLLNYPDTETLRSEVHSCFEQTSKKFYPYCRVTFGLSMPAQSLSTLVPEQASRASLYRLSIGVGQVIAFEKYHFSSYPLRTPTAQKAFINAFDALHTKPVDDWLEKVRQHTALPSIDAYDMYRDLLWITQNLIHDRLSEALAPEALSDLRKAGAFRLSIASTKPALLDTFYATFTEGLNLYIANQKKAGSKYIQMTKQYVEQHYNENVVLEDIAGTVYINPVYLSILFKKEEGKNFSEYLTEYRIEKAKELLKQGSAMNMEQLSKMVGYQDARYFSKLFTRIVGIKPSDYRRLY